MTAMRASSDNSDRQAPGRWLGLLLCVALCIRAVVPLGYMPGDLLDGKFVELCPTSSPALAAFLGSEGDHSGHGAHGADEGSDQGRAADLSRACPVGFALNFAALIALPDELFTPSIAREPVDVAPTKTFASIAAVAFRARGPPRRNSLNTLIRR